MKYLFSVLGLLLMGFFAGELLIFAENPDPGIMALALLFFMVSVGALCMAFLLHKLEK